MQKEAVNASHFFQIELRGTTAYSFWSLSKIIHICVFNILLIANDSSLS